jgi:hypothetical protein
VCRMSIHHLQRAGVMQWSFCPEHKHVGTNSL